MTVDADQSLFDPRSYSNWLAIVLIIATAVLMLSLRRKAKTKDYLHGDPRKAVARRVMDSSIHRTVFVYRGGAFGNRVRTGPPRANGLAGLYARLLEKTRR